MSLVTIEDQSPTMRRAKMRLVLAVVLLVVAIGGLFSMGRKATPQPDVATQQPVKASPAHATAAVPAAAHAVVASKPQTTIAAPAPAPAEVEPEPAKPPQAPPDPVYTSFTADAAYIAANPPAAAPVEPDEAATAPTKPATAQAMPQPKPQPKAAAPAKAEERIEASVNGQYLLQAGVFAEMENARHQLEKLAQHHIDTHIESKVRIGPFANTGEVDSAREKVKAAGINTTLDEYTGAKGSMLQASVLTDMESAKQLQVKLDEIGLASRCETRILIGPFDTKAKADAARNRIKALNISVVLL